MFRILKIRVLNLFRISDFLSLLCLCAFVTLCLLLSSGCSKPAQNDNEKQAQRSIKQKTSIKKPEKKTFTYSSHGKRDIFVPLVSKEEGIISDKTKGIVVLKLPDLKVEGILFDKDSVPFVIINDRILTIGDSVNECEITSITADEIVLIYMNKEYSLKVSDSGISSKEISSSSITPKKKEVKSAAASKQSLKKQLAQAKEEINKHKDSLLSERKKTIDAASDSKKKIQELRDGYTEQLAEANSSIGSLQSRIKSLVQGETDLKKQLAEKTEERIIIKAMPVETGSFNEEIQGEIVSVNKKTGIVAISFEKHKDISGQKGKKFAVFHKNKLIDKLVIKKVYNTTLVAGVDVFDNIKKIKKGDTVQLLNRDVTE